MYARRLHVLVFFFQAEDGIRDYKVTGVQTCALPISTSRTWAPPPGSPRAVTPIPPPRSKGSVGGDTSLAPGFSSGPHPNAPRKDHRSEERRVGKEGRSRWAPDH